MAASEGLKGLCNHLRKLASPEKAKVLSSFFKTGKGQYGEGDIFLGVTVPEQRRAARRYADLSPPDIQSLLASGIHEHRLTALLILVHQFGKADEQGRGRIVECYLCNTRYVNNWDLVDLSADKILGAYLADKDASILYDLAASENLWDRRIAMVATFAFIKKNRYDDTLRIASRLLRDPHELVHKAVGWMLREVGKRDIEAEEQFLEKYSRAMPRVMLRYAIERFTEERKTYYMRKV
jgi:3-methyladenine DNA glycosylase AlkD